MASGTPAPAAKKPRAARKPPANGRAPKRAAAVAVAELHGTSGPTAATFYGVTVEVPAELPSTFMMDYAELQEMQVEQHPGAIGMAAKLVKSVIGYLKEFKGFLTEDGDGFVVKPENLVVNTSKLSDGRQMFTVTGAAVFGAE